MSYLQLPMQMKTFHQSETGVIGLPVLAPRSAVQINDDVETVTLRPSEGLHEVWEGALNVRLTTGDLLK